MVFSIWGKQESYQMVPDWEVQVPPARSAIEAALAYWLSLVVRTMPVVRMLGRQRRSAGLSQEFFVKRYHWLFGDVLFSRDRFSVYSMNRLAKRFIFFIIPRRRGRKTPDKKETV